MTGWRVHSPDKCNAHAGLHQNQSFSGWRMKHERCNRQLDADNRSRWSAAVFQELCAARVGCERGRGVNGIGASDNPALLGAVAWNIRQSLREGFTLDYDGESNQSQALTYFGRGEA